MNDNGFVDTNILVYFRDASEPAKQARAAALMKELWETRRGRTGIQVLNEFYVTVTRKLTPGLSARQAWEDVRALMAWEPVPVDKLLVLRAGDAEREYRLSWWDALIVAAAERAGCRTLYSEDFAKGREYFGITVCNPFA